MAHYLIKHIIFGALCAGATLTLVGCTDNSYDLDKVDLTMGIGSEGLSAKLGNTEQIFLKDILEDDKSVKTDANSLYYMVKEDATDFDINIKKVTTSINSPELTQRLLDYNTIKNAIGSTATDNQPLVIPNGFSKVGKTDVKKSTDFQVNFVADDVKSIKNVNVQPTDVSVVIKLNTSTKVSVKELNNIVITLPKYMHVATTSAGWTLSDDNKLKCSKLQGSQIGKEICKLTLTALNINKTVENRKLDISDNVHITADVTLVNNTGASIQWKKTDFADIVLEVNIGNSSANKTYALTVNQVTGKFNPTINPAKQTIDIQNDLPDFLTGDDVRVDVSNPTVRMIGNLRNIPVGVNVGCTLTPYKDNKEVTKNKVTVTNTDVNMDANKVNTIYLFKGKSPYDPEGLASEYDSKEVDDLNNLIKEIPDYIVCNMQDNQIVVQDQEYTVSLGQLYHGKINYKIFIPFEFNNGLQIAYNDETNSMNSDLKDYAAQGVKVSTEVENTIPLDLKVSIEAYDLQDKKIPGITFKDLEGHDYVIIPASKDETTASKTNIELNADLDNPQDLSKVNRLKFKVSTSNTEAGKSHKLVSTQYLQFKDIKIRLKGGVVIDFN